MKKVRIFGIFLGIVVTIWGLALIADALSKQDRYPNPDNFRPIGTTARIIDAGKWANGHWYAMAASSWSGADLLRFVQGDFTRGVTTKQIKAGVMVVQRPDGWAILPSDPPH